MKSPWIPCGVVVALATLLFGCSRPRHVAGGTTGTLHAGSVVLGDMQVTVYRVAGTSPQVVGMGITQASGHFELVLPGAKGPLHLTPRGIPHHRRIGRPDSAAVPEGLWLGRENAAAGEMDSRELAA